MSERHELLLALARADGQPWASIAESTEHTAEMMYGKQADAVMEILARKSNATVWASPGRQSGQPCLMGTRMPTRTVAHIAVDRGIAMVQKMYPHLSEQQILDALHFEAVFGRGKAYRKRVRKVRAACGASDLSDASGRVDP